MQNLKKLDLKIHKLVDSLFVGNYKTAFKGRGLEFVDYALYEPGDDSKYIDFIASKREQKLLVKRFREERELSVYFIIDLSKSMDFGYETQTKKDTLIETFYFLSYSAITNNDKIGAILFNEDGFEIISLAKQKKAIFYILDKIDKFKPKKIEGFSINYLFNFFNSLKIKNSLVFFLSDKMGEIDDNKLKIQAIKNDFIYINIFDNFENNLTQDKYVFNLGNAVNNLFINTFNKEKIEKYKVLRQSRISQFKKKINTFNADYLLVDNKTNIFAILLEFFRGR